MVRSRRAKVVSAFASLGLVGSVWMGPVAMASGVATPTTATDSGYVAESVAEVPTPDGGGFWGVNAAGQVWVSGDATFYGDLSDLAALNQPIVGMAATPDGGGYWLVASDGGVFPFGDAGYFGSTGDLVLNAPIIEMVATPDGGGYWLLGADGGVFTFGDAQFYGSTGGTRLNAPVVGIAATPDGEGYWLVASDGGVFAYGDARFYGSTGGLTLNAPITGMARDVGGDGYWLVASDGGVFTFGSAPFSGSGVGLPLFGASSIVPTADGDGYWVFGLGGIEVSFGTAALLAPPGASMPAPGSTTAQVANADAEQWWLAEADVLGAVYQNVPLDQAIIDLEYGENHGLAPATVGPVISALIGETDIPETDVTPAQDAQGAADQAVIDSYFDLPGTDF